MMVEPTAKYDAAYHAELEAGSVRSAQALVPRVLELIRPRSVVDVGCGSGAWAAEAAAAGVEDVFGIDGPWVEPETLLIAEKKFLAADIGAALDLGRRFDLAFCLEVAEHLPESAARQFVANLSGLSPVILFSAAIPGQGGEGHVHEAYPSRWSKEFGRSGYECHDVFRGEIWDDQRIEYWYRQNVVLFIERGHLDTRADLQERLLGLVHRPSDLVHPDLFAARLRYARETEQEWNKREHKLAAAYELLSAELSKTMTRLNQLGEAYEALVNNRDLLSEELRRATRLRRHLGNAARKIARTLSPR